MAIRNRQKNSIDLNILSFLLKWEAHKAEMKLLQEYKKENLQYLKDKKTKEGVICTESGLQYKILEEGKGETPSPKDYVSFTLKSSFIDGTIFNEIKKPFNVRTDLVIKGLSEALTRMPLGSKWIIYVPSDLGHGSNKVNNIKPYSTLIYEVHLVGIGKQP